MTAVRLKITGAVQGVGCRYAFQRLAQTLKLVGWVKNEPDGSVSAWIQGPDQAVQELIAVCRAGFGRIRVEQVAVTQMTLDKKLADFKIIF